jgi:hypothetical protein
MRAVVALFALTLLAADHVGPPEAYPPAGIGLANPAITQENIRQTICVPNWTKTVRPPASYTDKLKKQWLADHHLNVPLNSGEWDHMESIEIGGHPTDPRNMWFEPYAGKYGAKLKDKVEDKLHRLICATEDPMPLVVAQRCILSDWILCGQQIGVIPK